MERDFQTLLNDTEIYLSMIKNIRKVFFFHFLLPISLILLILHIAK